MADVHEHGCMRLYVAQKLDYSDLQFVKPYMNSDIDACKKVCLGNCSCTALFFENSTGNCFLFDHIGGLKHAELVATVMVIAGLLYVGFYYYHKQKRLLECAQENLEEDNFLDSFSGMPVRYTYHELCKATKNFSKRFGQGRFGSVYLGVMPDGTQLSVKN
ncbi:hypothetical protein CRYUN_Cryun34aG0088800 [Craigia yunnanensis]